jgi:hypothetical protein
MSGDPSLAITKLDFRTFWDGQNGLVLSEVRPQRLCWPGLEVIHFLALNPQYCQLMDGKTTPFLMAPGLAGDAEFAPGFGRGGRKFCILARRAHHGLLDTAAVAFRKL